MTTGRINQVSFVRVVESSARFTAGGGQTAGRAGTAGGRAGMQGAGDRHHTHTTPPPPPPTRTPTHHHTPTAHETIWSPKRVVFTTCPSFNTQTPLSHKQTVNKADAWGCADGPRAPRLRAAKQMPHTPRTHTGSPLAPVVFFGCSSAFKPRTITQVCDTLGLGKTSVQGCAPAARRSVHVARAVCEACPRPCRRTQQQQQHATHTHTHTARRSAQHAAGPQAFAIMVWCRHVIPTG